MFAALGCDDDENPYWNNECRFDPSYCRGGLGGSCRGNVDCFEGSCCTAKHCGGGMCTFSCNTDNQCPIDMACEHNVCLFMCRDDFDCAVGQRCEHAHSVCEWP